jgi:serine/threonine protein kinase
VIPQSPGETVTSELTRNTYTMGEKIGEGFFGLVYSCVDVWDNKLAVKVLKGAAPYEVIEAAAQADIQKLLVLRHPYITYAFDAFHLAKLSTWSRNVAIARYLDCSRRCTALMASSG